MSDSNPFPGRFRCIARAVLEAEAPLGIASGRDGGLSDTALVLDANGLPAIPGSSIAGVLRQLARDTFGEPATTKLFGGIDKRDTASRLCISWGVMHDSGDQPVETTCDPANPDPLVRHARRLLRRPFMRDGVRLTHRGAAAFRGRYDRSLVPRGFRFSVEFELLADEDPAHDPANPWDTLLSLLNHPAFRLGAGTRRGLGRVRLERLHRETFDLADTYRRRAYLALGRRLGDTAGLQPWTPPVPVAAGWEAIDLTWTPLGTWRIGQGDVPLLAGKAADLLPRIEPAVVWTKHPGKSDSGRLEPRAHLVLPGSGLKGAIAHRVAFHANRLAGAWAAAGMDTEGLARRNDAVLDLFGHEGVGADPARAGMLLFDDGLVPVQHGVTRALTHTALDRYTGGVRLHMLFDEEVACRGAFAWKIRFRGGGACAGSRAALRAALLDLAEGRLALGAGAAHGHGYGEGTLTWNEPAAPAGD